ncbi:dTMP kinase [Weissella thailandensis]|uniref:Thymidylate kinase n=1 Tax=Weissella thailandensis TaxID=89061 RepID=A0ABX9I840_9LACO|nr:dTMP kinase [Weissella thailandensis]NKY90982.1 dTMP kinase [Weissella thailandensis]RDS59486.1 dTMP kinase [Weissella thailandensis]GEP74422.1 thymidylate kinase [Weissella thailandensis]HJG85073.1 dTMP kinase [Weissella thailandensis]
MSGTFITFEGPDGAGKTSVLRAIVQRLTPLLGDRLVLTREPGGKDSQVAEAIRDLVLDPNLPSMDAWTEALLYAASRRQHLVDTVLPALAADKVVVSDRYVDSSIAYQGGGRDLGIESVTTINQFATKGVMPTATVYLDIRPEVGLQRIQENRQDEINRLDVEALSFHQRVTDAYHQLAAQYPERFLIINAEQDLADVITDTWTALMPILGMHD